MAENYWFHIAWTVINWNRDVLSSRCRGVCSAGSQVHADISSHAIRFYFLIACEIISISIDRSNGHIRSVFSINSIDTKWKSINKKKKKSRKKVHCCSESDGKLVSLLTLIECHLMKTFIEASDRSFVHGSYAGSDHCSRGSIMHGFHSTLDLISFYVAAAVGDVVIFFAALNCLTADIHQNSCIPIDASAT